MQIDIGDYHEGTQVGTVDEDGNLQTDSSALEEVARPMIDDGIDTIRPIDGPDGETVYNEYHLEPGDEGWLREFCDELPSPFDGDFDVLLDLPTFEPEDDDYDFRDEPQDQEKSDFPVACRSCGDNPRLKGSMVCPTCHPDEDKESNTTEDDLVARTVDEERVTDPPSGSNDDGDEKQKARRYVSDPSEVPDDKEVMTGEQGGTYYLTWDEGNEDEHETDESNDGGILDDIVGGFDYESEDEENENNQDENEPMSFEERQDLYRGMMEKLPVVPDPPSGDSSSTVDLSSNEFKGGNVDDDTLRSATSNLREGELLGEYVNTRRIEDDSDYGPFNAKTTIPFYDGENSKFAHTDIMMDTEDYSNLQSRIHEKYTAATRESHFGSANPDDVESYAEAMQDPEDDGFPIPHFVVNEDGDVTNEQEGRHRALAAMHAGFDEIPVRVIVEPGKDSTPYTKNDVRKEWVPDPTERAPNRWVNTLSGDYRYQESKPGSTTSQQQDEQSSQSSSDTETPDYFGPVDIEGINSMISREYSPRTSQHVEMAFDQWDKTGYNNTDSIPIWERAVEETGGEVPEEIRSAFEQYQSEGKIHSRYIDSPEELSDAVESIIEKSREKLRSEHGDEVTVYRGLTQDTIQNYTTETEDGGLQLNPLAMESWTTDSSYAYSWAPSGCTLKQSVPIEDVLFDASLVLDDHSDTGELTLKGGEPYTIDESNWAMNKMVKDDIDTEQSDELPPLMPAESLDWLRQSSDDSRKQKEWVQDPTEQAPNRWTHTSTGEHRYQEEKPEPLDGEDDESENDAQDEDSSDESENEQFGEDFDAEEDWVDTFEMDGQTFDDIAGFDEDELMQIVEQGDTVVVEDTNGDAHIGEVNEVKERDWMTGFDVRVDADDFSRVTVNASKDPEYRTKDILGVETALPDEETDTDNEESSDDEQSGGEESNTEERVVDFEEAATEEALGQHIQVETVYNDVEGTLENYTVYPGYTALNIENDERSYSVREDNIDGDIVLGGEASDGTDDNENEIPENVSLNVEPDSVSDEALEHAREHSDIQIGDHIEFDDGFGGTQQGEVTEVEIDNIGYKVRVENDAGDTRTFSPTFGSEITSHEADGETSGSNETSDESQSEDDETSDNEDTNDEHTSPPVNAFDDLSDEYVERMNEIVDDLSEDGHLEHARTVDHNEYIEGMGHYTMELENGRIVGDIEIRETTDIWGLDGFMYEEELEMEYEAGYASTPAAHHTLIHEIGHASHLGGLRRNEYDDLDSQSFTREEEEMIEDQVSRLGSSSPIEFVAEVFAMKYEGIDVSPEVQDIYERLGGSEI